MKKCKITFNHKKIVNIYIVYEICKKITVSDYPTLENCFIEAVSFTKNADIGRYRCSGYGIGFDRHVEFSFPGIGRLGRNVIIFGVDTSSSVHVGNKKIYILILGKGPTQRLEHTLTAEKCIPLILQGIRKNFVWICITMKQTVIYLLMVKKFINLRQKILGLQQLHYI